MTDRQTAFWGLAGVVTAMALQFVVPERDGVRWWLDTAGGVAIGARVFFLAGIAAGVSMAWPPWRPGQWLRALFLWLGINAGLAIALFANGAGNLFPIVMAVGAVYSLCAVVPGSILGAALRGLGEGMVGLVRRSGLASR